MKGKVPANFPINSSGKGWSNGSFVNDITTTTNMEWFRILKLFLYTTIFMISATGNSLVCVIILRRKKMKTVTNYFILNLAIADLALTCICIPFDIPVQEMDYAWPYGAFMCKFLYPLQTLTLFASIYTLTAVSLTRYWAIVHPLRVQLSIAKTKVVIVIIWIGSLVPIVPYMNSLNLKNNSCEELWKSSDIRSIYTVCLFVFQYILPLMIIATAYTGIAGEMRRRDNSYDNCPMRQMQVRETRKVVKMLLVVTICFALCVLPNNIMWLWLDFGQADQHISYFWELLAFCNIITFANSAANPICYTALNDNYRREFKRYLIIMFCKKKSTILLRRLSTMTTSVRKSMNKSSKEEYFGVQLDKVPPRLVGVTV
ncbi:galanin receptor type 1-like [Actinia tenebrosa]|uniref:Galanin receptor type 1-like n=1 Tax=Actinia tenebrosa TaxID=6105 RepID=A0A6P8IBI8_ACTTE|nr:galanin receptor type 1-like [Actinia tenebrosa]XP_031562173.1 galanin receptor type 1-like [Actinia tenebrosa]XP_031562174.1 galanin receptor type 1-like [Actinia tenebrosa]XP_031562175.1 galanin receptor type 1-like [Actinia tenebrosa]XP_031562176.1 galanin receptor type 1-like [Actinia tenebrosa]XP_031562177.1 galanin receptor type 1-like [Actinia tenebrosa]XP_031562178.1 galanin receptor type 1-like [Actinia tenebrosa]XP_031562179.1 galanin receptor type 1-like [Actinia tenebrosa]XP_